MNKRRRKKEARKWEVRGFVTERLLSRFIEKHTAPGTPYGDAIAESLKYEMPDTQKLGDKDE